MSKREELTNFIVRGFDYLLTREEQTMGKVCSEVSLKEIHLIDKIGDAEKRGNNTAGEIARDCGVTLGTLTTTTNKLASKGYIDRIKADLDKRIIRLTLTEKGYSIYKRYKAYHTKLASDTLLTLTPEDQDELFKCIRLMEKYFLSGENKND